MNNLQVGDCVNEKYTSHGIIAKVICLDDKHDLVTVVFEHKDRIIKRTVPKDRLIKVLI